MSEFLTNAERKLIAALDKALEIYAETEPLTGDEPAAFRQSVEGARNLIMLRNTHRQNEQQYPPPKPEGYLPEPEEFPVVGPSELKADEAAEREGDEGQ